MPTHAPAIRIARVGHGHPCVQSLIQRMVDLSQKALPTMFRGDRHEFGFTMRKTGDGQRLEGSSVRYGAIVVLGASNLDDTTQRLIFGGQNATEFCSRLIEIAGSNRNLGDVALIAWAAALLRHAGQASAFDVLGQRLDELTDGYTVEVAWALSALAEAQGAMRDNRAFAEGIRRRLMEAFNTGGQLFGHYVGARARRRGVRGHVGCFADQVYPIQALARFHHAFNDAEAMHIASRCAGQICRLQGPGGQWWWHYDIRTGQVIEGYPVYSVHQNSMAPMALLDLHEAGGPDHADAIRLGLSWMESAPEIGRSLIDEGQLVIWRKVARGDPKKIVRKLRAIASWVHPSFRLRLLDGLFRPRSTDFESRPYHLGWILHAWLGGL